MKYILHESQIKKFNKEGVFKGKYGELVERLLEKVLKNEPICDMVVVNSLSNLDLYIVLILYNGPSPWELQSKLENLIRNFLPISVMVMITDIEC
jgi:hypothetical protein